MRFAWCLNDKYSGGVSGKILEEVRVRAANLTISHYYAFFFILVQLSFADKRVLVLTSHACFYFLFSLNR